MSCSARNLANLTWVWRMDWRSENNRSRLGDSFPDVDAAMERHHLDVLLSADLPPLAYMEMRLHRARPESVRQVHEGSWHMESCCTTRWPDGTTIVPLLGEARTCSRHHSSALLLLGTATKWGAPKWIRELALPLWMDRQWIRLNLGLCSAGPNVSYLELWLCVIDQCCSKKRKKLKKVE